MKNLSKNTRGRTRLIAPTSQIRIKARPRTHGLRFAALLSLAVALASPAASRASSIIDAHVFYAGTYANGDGFVCLAGTLIDEAGCNSVRFDIPASHPQLRTWLTIANTAIATGGLVQVRTKGCITSSDGHGGTQIFPTMDSSSHDSWFLLR